MLRSPAIQLLFYAIGGQYDVIFTIVSFNNVIEEVHGTRRLNGNDITHSASKNQNENDFIYL